MPVTPPPPQRKTARPETVRFSRHERNIFLHLLTACNLKCRHCYINPRQHGRKRLSEDQIGAWLKLFFKPEKQNNLVLLGGEPTLHPHLAAAVKTARTLGYHSVTVDTNGTRLAPWLEKITPEQAVLSFSLDGPTPRINDSIRGPGVYAACLKSLEQAVSKGFQVSLIYTVRRDNLHHLAAMPTLLEQRGVARFFIQVIGLRGKSARGPQPLQPTAEEWIEIVPQVAADAAARGIEVIYPKVFLDPGETFECAGQVAENFFIFPNGRVYRCPLCEDLPIHAHSIQGDRLLQRRGLTEAQLFTLKIPEGCVMNKLLQPGNIDYDEQGRPRRAIACCLLKQHLTP
ncbi:MAG: radical SAM protein [Desulfobacterales bacterium]